ncbi:methyltransferase domain-containing protein [Oceanospirillaceae bacterium ASx5O]|nr:methyltransferase domain-containing protein [Oceanospirillaceae bacterium ASx5O]
MSVTVSRIKPEEFQRWLQQPATQRLLALQAGWLRDRVAGLHGCHLLYCGIDPQPRFLQRARIRHSFRLGLPWSAGCAEVDARIQDDAWPLPDESVDVVILQHSLDLSRRPHQLIREAVRCLVPEGYLLITGFNPYSPWGGWRWLRNFSTRLPWVSRPVAPARLQDWLTLLDLRLEEQFPCAHWWPLSAGSEQLSRRVDRVLAGSQLLPAACYLMVARKTVAGVTPIRPRRWYFSEHPFAMPVPAASRSATGTTRDIT